MSLFRLIYSSKRLDTTEVSDLLSLLGKSTENNRKNNITGVLCFTKGFFIQILEGESSSVNKLYNKIVADKRHTEVTLINYSSCAKREFPDWSMGFIGFDVISKVLPKKDFKPNSMIKDLNATNALLLLKEFGNQLHR